MKATELALERATVELDSLRHVSKSLITSQTEVAQLNELVAELKRQSRSTLLYRSKQTDFGQLVIENTISSNTNIPFTSAAGGAPPASPLTFHRKTASTSLLGSPLPRPDSSTSVHVTVADVGIVTDIYGLLNESDVVRLPGGRKALGNLIQYERWRRLRALIYTLLLHHSVCYSNDVHT